METLQAFTWHGIIDMSWFPWCWSVIAEDLPIDHLGKPSQAREGGSCGSSSCIHSFPLRSWCSAMAYRGTVISMSPCHRQGPVRTQWGLASLIAGLLHETACARSRGLDTGREENEIGVQEGSDMVWNWDWDSQIQKYSRPHDEGGGVFHYGEVPSQFGKLRISPGTSGISAIASFSWLPAACVPPVHQKFCLQLYPGSCAHRRMTNSSIWTFSRSAIADWSLTAHTDTLPAALRCAAHTGVSCLWG